ncbi:MAG: hypothetical protein ACM3XM_12955 [Mycobacterium leprae]
MTQGSVASVPGTLRRERPSPRNAVTLSLRQPAPADWHRDRPAFAGDPFMDWENSPEPPREEAWGLQRQIRT